MSTQTRKARLLVAEDDDEMREVLRRALVTEGYQVDAVEDGYELRDYLEACQPQGRLPSPDLVVSDIRLPGPDALTVLSELKRTVARFVLITGFRDRRTQLLGTLLGAKLILDKPVDLEVLRDGVRRALSEAPA